MEQAGAFVLFAEGGNSSGTRRRRTGQSVAFAHRALAAFDRED
jgi:hypothetical protein